MSDDFDVRAAVDGAEPYQANRSGGSGFRASPATDAPAQDVGRGGLPGWRLRRVVDYMTENLDRDIDVDDLVNRCGLSRAQFFRAFRQSTRQTPHRYLVGLRLDRARFLLETTTLAVADVTRSVGMGSNAGFARLFQERFGDQPSRYRRGFQAAKGRRSKCGLVG